MIMPGLSVRTWATILSAALLVVTVRIEEGRVATARQRASELALEVANAKADGDSTRLVGAGNERMTRLLHDSLQLVERLVVQKTQRQDELDHALQRERIARFRASMMTDSLSTSSRGAVDTSQGEGGRPVRRARFLIRQVPYTLSAEVTLPEAPDTGVMSAHVVLDTLYLETRVGCAAPDASGIRQATVSATTPRWATVRFDRVEQSPELCGSPAIAKDRRRHSWLGGVPWVVGVGPVLDRGGRVSWGVFAGVGRAATR